MTVDAEPNRLTDLFAGIDGDDASVVPGGNRRPVVRESDDTLLAREEAS